MGLFFGKKTPDQLRQEIRQLEEEVRSLDESIRYVETKRDSTYDRLDRTYDKIDQITRSGINKRLAGYNHNINAWMRLKLEKETIILALQAKLVKLEKEST